MQLHFSDMPRSYKRCGQFRCSWERWIEGPARSIWAPTKTHGCHACSIRSAGARGAGYCIFLSLNGSIDGEFSSEVGPSGCLIFWHLSDQILNCSNCADATFPALYGIFWSRNTVVQSTAQCQTENAVALITSECVTSYSLLLTSESS